jgi:plasmid stabilization system protein ParE
MRPPKGRGKTPPPAVEWTDRALADLREIDDYIAADDPAAADRWIARLMATAEAAARTPLAGRVVPERANEGVREVFLRTYRVVYRVRERGILVLTVFEGHRRFPPGVE